jgi:hypothetical protein
MVAVGELGKIIDKLEDEMQFGIFENGMKCFFQDGTKVSYSDLWRAVRIVKNINATTSNSTLFQLFPETFVGSHPHKWFQHRWTKPLKRSMWLATESALETYMKQGAGVL